MKLAKGLNIGDIVETSKEHDESVGIHYEGVIYDVDPRDYNYLGILTDEGEMINIHVNYVNKCVPTVKMYANKRYREQEGKKYFHNIFKDSCTTSMCAANGEKIFQIKVREALPEEETPYHGWKHPDGTINLIFPSKVQVEVCFAYGTKAATEHGDGELVKLIVTEIDNKISFSDDTPQEERETILNIFPEIKELKSSIHLIENNAHVVIEIGSSKVKLEKIEEKNTGDDVYLITFNDNSQLYCVVHEDKCLFFKDYNKYKYLKSIIYGKAVLQ